MMSDIAEEPQSFATIICHNSRILVIGVVLIGLGVLPEERAREFRSLTDVSIASDMKVIKELTLEDNKFIYAVNDFAHWVPILLEVMQE